MQLPNENFPSSYQMDIDTVYQDDAHKRYIGLIFTRYSTSSFYIVKKTLEGCSF